MTKREQYGLRFERIKSDGFSAYFSCSPSSNINGSGELALLLDLLSDNEPRFLLDEVQLAITGGVFEEYYSPDNAQGYNGVRLAPPNAIIHNSFTIPLIELKALILEWITFVES
jgi:hypothetical protein